MTRVHRGELVMRGTQFSQLTAFVAVAESRSFSKAATHLGTVTSSVSQAVRSLEEKFDVRLLNRTTRSVSLTDAGEQLLGHLRPILEDVNRAVDSIYELRDRPAGTLRLSVHPLAAVTVIGPMVTRFAAKFPNIGLEISVDPEYKDIVSERFDAGIHPGDGIPQDMIAVPIGRQLELSAVASPRYLARRGVPSMPTDLSSHSCITYCWSPPKRRQVWKFCRADHGVDVAIEESLVVNDPTLALQAGLDGYGIVQLPEMWVSPLVAEGKLVKILEEWSLRLANFRLFYASRKHVSAKLRVFVDFLRKASREPTFVNGGAERSHQVGHFPFENVFASHSGCASELLPVAINHEIIDPQQF
jgi:DNA-binding transcriptional LysR family regulator